MLDFFVSLFSQAQQLLFEEILVPLLFAMGMANFLEDGLMASGWFVAGCVQLLLIVTVIGSLQRWRPVRAVQDHATVRTDMLYTLLHRLGLFRLLVFFLLKPWLDELFGVLRVAGLETWHLDALWPGVTDRPLVSLLIYLLAFDLFAYWLHRAQHHFNVLWRLHSLHHAQRELTMWSDNRNHLLDDLLRHVLQAVLAQLIGVPPAQYVAIVVLTQLSESLQHANVRLWFGRWGERLWISPCFHRRHHGLDGMNHNFGVLLPWWDMLFGTARFQHRFDPTGVPDQLESSRDYGLGFWSQQWQGLKRLVGQA
ncbi:MAG: hypothetical protein RLZZ591_759 [Pseudomonadota bacterium]|jgi:sterol desaturase/sphingolipid hydroxylase (fatty acid hydroxylase superfamily)